VAATEIVRCHANFAYMMARRITGAADIDRSMGELARDMGSSSSSLSQKIGDMMSDLAELVSSLEKIEVEKEKEKEQSTMQRILGWLEGFLNGLAEVFSCGLFIIPLVPPRVGLGMIQIVPSLSKLCREAAELCKKASGRSRGMHTPLPHSGCQNE